MGEIKPERFSKAGQHILYDGCLTTQLGYTGPQIKRLEKWFELETWQEAGAISGQAKGRGTSYFFESGGKAFVLRHYRRGGFPAKLSRDRYVWLGLEKNRAWSEWRILSELYRRGLPVPRPLAARVIKSGMTYTADLITHRIAGAESLFSRLADGELGDNVWHSIGVTIRAFHTAGADHADLNARNILLDNARIYLIDFDNSRIRVPKNRNSMEIWQKKNLQRLLRSLQKLQSQNPGLHFSKSDWEVLLKAYQAG